MTINPDPAKARVQPTLLAAFLAALSMLGPFSIDTIFPAFPPIGREFSAIAPVVGALLLRAGGWRGIFWSLALLATFLGLVSAWWLRESHPVSLRHPFAPKALLKTYRRIGSEPRFCALALTAAMNFGALFL